ncbi:protein of unknown function [Prevotella sp. khp1]|uniref:DUF4421 family protein n=1 Tax=Prevotellaceae TaxID=171552 RepID=UPI00088455C4|nr:MULTISPECIES: DUF4421 family protein [Prevotellaceae]QVJ82116.1 DUF4421 family protein [Xylanibacter ruminicola]SDQ32381.1 protein of unknown function [Prevotella sp. khp1]
MTVKHILIAIGIGCCGTATAQGGLTTFMKKVGTMIDSMSVRGLDRNYIDAPEKPWQLIAKGNVNQTIVSMNADGNILGVDYSARPYLKTQPSQYVGFWAGYRGYGIGYTVNVGGDKGSNLVFGATGGAYGVNVRIHSFDNSNPSINLNSELLSEEEQETWDDVQLIDPIHVRTVIADGYYMFNGKKFSYAAAYDQSVIQKRSAGSLMAGLMYNYTHIDYATDLNGDLVYLMHGLGKVKLWQGSAGVGYAYNWVPARGLLVNVMLMPMVTFVNKLKVFAYATNVPELMTDERFWGDDISNEEWDEWFYSNVHITPMGDKTINSGISLGFDTRMSVTYNFGRYFISAYGQFNNIRYRHQSTHGYLNDWFINTAIGIRL